MASVFPGTGAAVLIYADIPGFPRARGIVGYDHRDVPDFRDDRVLHVTVALAKSSRMEMHVGDDPTPGFAAVVPESTQLAAVNYNDAGAQGIRVDVVIEDEFFNNALLHLGAEQKRAGFADSS